MCIPVATKTLNVHSNCNPNVKSALQFESIGSSFHTSNWLDNHCLKYIHPTCNPSTENAFQLRLEFLKYHIFRVRTFRLQLNKPSFKVHAFQLQLRHRMCLLVATRKSEVHYYCSESVRFSCNLSTWYDCHGLKYIRAIRNLSSESEFHKST